MRWNDIAGCLALIQSLTGCDKETARLVYIIVADYAGGNLPDNWQTDLTPEQLKMLTCLKGR